MRRSARWLEKAADTARLLPPVLLTVVLVACSPGGSSSNSGNGPSTTARDQFIAQLNRGLDDLIAQTERLPQNPLIFSANDALAHEAWVDRFARDLQLDYLDGLIEARVHRIDINMGLFPWYDGPMVPGANGDRARAIATYDALVDRIRARQLRLVINPQYSGAYHRMASFDDWAAAAVPVYAVIAARYRPDTLIVVHEPTTMASRLGVTVTPQQWTEFTAAAVSAVKGASPSTRCGIGGLHTEEAYLRPMMDVPGVDVLTLDIYELSGLTAYNQLVTLGRQRGKAVYIEETWRTPFSTDSTLSPDQRGAAGIGLDVFQPLDVKWIRFMALYAGALNLEAVTPYWSQTFFKYVSSGGDGTDPAYNLAVMQAVTNGERTPTFFGLQEIIRSSVPPRGLDLMRSREIH